MYKGVHAPPSHPDMLPSTHSKYLHGMLYLPWFRLGALMMPSPPINASASLIYQDRWLIYEALITISHKRQSFRDMGLIWSQHLFFLFPTEGNSPAPSHRTSRKSNSDTIITSYLPKGPTISSQSLHLSRLWYFRWHTSLSGQTCTLSALLSLNARERDTQLTLFLDFILLTSLRIIVPLIECEVEPVLVIFRSAPPPGHFKWKLSL